MGSSKQKISIQPGYVLVERAKNYQVIGSEQTVALMQISAACEEAGCQKVLVLGSKTKVRLSTQDIFDLGEGIAKLGLQIAVVESHDASTKDVKFLEQVVENRGGPLRFFDREQDAKEWLGLS